MFQESSIFADSTANLISLLKAEDNVRIDAAADFPVSVGLGVPILLPKKKLLNLKNVI